MLFRSKACGVKRILEVGTAIGYSSIVMAQAAGEGCKIITIEKSDEMCEKALKNIREFGYEEKIEVAKGDAMDVLNNIQGSFDMVFLDAAKGHYDHFLPMCLEHLKINGILVSDNALFRGMVANNNLLVRRKITIVKRMRKYLKHISSMDELETSLLPLGDGVALSCKIKEVDCDAKD